METVARKQRTYLFERFFSFIEPKPVYEILGVIFTGNPYFGRMAIAILPSCDCFGDSVRFYFCTIIASSNWPSISANGLPKHMWVH
jgi:hypothetical protein